MLEHPFSKKNVEWAEGEIARIAGTHAHDDKDFRMGPRFYFLMLVMACIKQYEAGAPMCIERRFKEESKMLSEIFSQRRQVFFCPSRLALIKLFPTLSMLAEIEIAVRFPVNYGNDEGVVEEELVAEAENY